MSVSSLRRERIVAAAHTKMSKLLILLVVLAACIGLTQASDFESALAAEVPELAERSADTFLTLNDLGESEQPEVAFTEMASDAKQETEAAAETDTEAKSESDDNAMLEVGSDPLPWHRSDVIQPVARKNAEITCIDGDCTRAIKVKKAKIGDHPNANTKPPPSKLDIALGAVKEEIMVRAKELHKEKDWAKRVAQLIDEYQQKLAKVTGNIAHLRAQTKELLRKKKQIQNVQVQNKLRYKLELAQSDLNRLMKQMEHIAGKENEFSDTEKELKSTMNALKASLLKLRGQDPKKLAKEGI